MTTDVLVVCSANVCRSPLAAALLARSLAGAGHDSVVRVRSAGVAVAVAQPACAAIRHGIHAGPDVELRLSAHVSRPLRPSDVERADLVLAADRAVRSAVVRVVPRAQARIFTLRQAAQLAAFVAGQGHRHPGGSASDVEDAAQRLVADLDLARGLSSDDTAGRPRTRGRWGRREEVHPHDIPDAHTSGATHSAVSGLLVETLDDLATALLRVLPAPPAPDAVALERSSGPEHVGP